jgi:hypothetical protein
MARIRSIKPELPSSRKMAGAPIPARYTFILLISQADDEGFVRAEPRQLLGNLYPHDESVTPDDLERWILDLVRVKSIRLRWTTDGARVIQVLGWEEHQVIKNPGKPKISPTLLPVSENSTEEIRQVSVESGGAEVRRFGGSEVGGSEGGESEDGAAGATSPATSSVVRLVALGDGLAHEFADETHRAAYVAYRKTHRMPDGMDAVLRTANHGGMGTHAPLAWEVMGAALVAMRALQVDFSQNALHGFARRVGEAPPAPRGIGSGDAKRAEMDRAREQVEQEIKSGLRAEGF